MNWIGVKAIYLHEMDRMRRTIIQSILSPVISTSLYFVVFGNDYNSFYDKLLEGTSGVAPIDRFDTSDFPTKFAAQIRNFDNEGYIDKKNDRRLDDCLRYALVSGNKALEDAGLAGEALAKVDKQRVGVLCGSGMGGLTVFQDGVKALVEKGPKKITPFFIPRSLLA